jgi:hypothetical protein
VLSSTFDFSGKCFRDWGCRKRINVRNVVDVLDLSGSVNKEIKFGLYLCMNGPVTVDYVNCGTS